MRKLITVGLVVAMAMLLPGCGGRATVPVGNREYEVEELAGVWRFVDDYAEQSANPDIVKAAIVFIEEDGTYWIDWMAYDSNGNYAIETGKCVVGKTVRFVPDDKEMYSSVELAISKDADRLYFTEESIFTMTIVDVLRKVE